MFRALPVMLKAWSLLPATSPHRWGHCRGTPAQHPGGFSTPLGHLQGVTLQTSPLPPLLLQRPAVTRDGTPAQVEHMGPAHNTFCKTKVWINTTERKMVGRPTLRDHYGSQDISKACQPFVIEPFTSFTVFQFFCGETLRQAAADLAHAWLPLW